MPPSSYPPAGAGFRAVTWAGQAKSKLMTPMSREGTDSALRRCSSRPHSRSTCMYRPVCRTSPRNNLPPGLSTRDLAHCRVPLGRIINVVQRLFGDDHVERTVGEREPAGVAVLDLHALGHPLQPGVLRGGTASPPLDPIWLALLS